MNSLKIWVICAAASLFLIACTQPQAANHSAATPIPPPAGPAQIAPVVDEATSGKELYAVNCMICHKDSGKGGKITLAGKTINPYDLTADKFKKMPDEKLIGYVTDGVEDEGMPAFKDKLSTDQIKAVIAHVRSLQN